MDMVFRKTDLAALCQRHAGLCATVVVAGRYGNTKLHFARRPGAR